MQRILIALLLLVLACPQPASERTADSLLPDPPVPTAGINSRTAVEASPHYDQSLGFVDTIAPIYEPEFAPATPALLGAEELILGVAWGGAARAYPISVLRFHEMVNDELAGVPILVSW